MNKKVYLLSSCVLALLTAPITASAETIKEQTQQIEQDLSEVTQQKLQVQEEIEATQKKIQELNQQITDSNKNIQKKEQELNKINEEIADLNEEEKEITTLLKNREAEFKDRVSSYYRTEGQMSFLNVVFSINSFEEFINYFVSYDIIVNEDKKFIEEYIQNQNKVAEIKEKVTSLQKSTVQEKAALELLKANQEKSKKEKETLTITLSEKKTQLEKEEQGKTLALELLQENSQEILNLINNDNGNYHGNIQIIHSVISPFVSDAQKLQKENGIPASIILGQILLESSGRYNGLSGLAYEAKNLFGVKGTGTAGSVHMDTTEYVDGQKIVTKAQFAKYNTYYDSMAAHTNLLLRPRYQKHLKNAKTIGDYAHGIHDAGYATDPNYAAKLMKVIYQYDLWKLDV
ncbi:glucosaminidase domain-containing protein [Priestia abyssalis]|uniref:glucosaminidase domain-containing protein n=1 Tax=Priestia abyssalis TaxID=1221450 RepID=UPI0009952345|nr:glucosaminidase domain-containing protein [Priestia abyssalis]